MLNNFKCESIGVVMATQSRSGSQFLLDLTGTALGGGNMYPQSRINGCRVDTLREDHERNTLQNLLNRNMGIASYFNKHQIKAIKLEEPSMGKTGHKLLNIAPNAKWLFSMRKIEDIVTSHYNIKSWGFPEQKVMRLWRANLQFYEFIVKSRRPLFIIDVSNPANNDLDKFCSFLDVDRNKSLEEKFNEWAVINPLARQKMLHKEKGSLKQTPPNIHTLRQRYDWVNGIETRYLRLFKSCTN
jgi:hypothetical protein